MGMKANKDAIGNLLAYISKKCPNVYITKLLKLLYLIDERAVRETGAPITWLEYEVWQYGPVAPDVYYSKNLGENRFSEFVEFSYSDSNSKVKSIIEPDMTVFSISERGVIDRVLNEFGGKSTTQLVKYTHQFGGLWDHVVKENGLNFDEEKNTSEHTIDFTVLIRDEDDKLANYYSTLENIEFQASLV